MTLILSKQTQRATARGPEQSSMLRSLAKLCHRHAQQLRAGSLLSLLLFLLGTVSADAQSAAVTEDDLRAAMVQHLTSFVDWPSAKLDATHPQFTICLLGADSSRLALESAFHNRTVFSKPVVVQRLPGEEKVDSCHLLYVGAGSRKTFLHLLPALQQASVLTVSERGDAQGQVIGLPAEDEHVVIQVDLRAAQASHLAISSRLLHLATLVNKQ